MSDRRLAFLLAGMLTPLAMRAELLKVEQRFGGIVCDSCAGSLEKSLARMRGITKASLNAGEGIATIELAPGNRLQLSGIRDRFKGAGYTPGEAAVTLKGSAVETAAGWEIVVDPSGERFPVASGSKVERGAGSFKGTISAGRSPELRLD